MRNRAYNYSDSICHDVLPTEVVALRPLVTHFLGYCHHICHNVLPAEVVALGAEP